MPFTYIVAFFPKTSRVFKKIFDFSFFWKSPFEPVQCKARKVPSPYKYLFLQNFTKHFENFSKIISSPVKKAKKRHPAAGRWRAGAFKNTEICKKSRLHS